MQSSQLPSLFHDGQARHDPTWALPEDPDLPAESYLVRVELWPYHVATAAHYRREDSTKTSSYPRQPSSSSLQRFSTTTNLKSTTTRVHGVKYVSRRRHLKPQVIKLNISAKKQQPSIIEPCSPKVSCFGNILPAAAPPAPENEEQLTVAGCWTGFASLFSWRRTAVAVDSSTEDDSLMQSRETSSRSNNFTDVEVSPVAPPPGIGEMKRLASARRAASWSEELKWEFAAADSSYLWSQKDRTAVTWPEESGGDRRRRDAE